MASFRYLFTESLWNTKEFFRNTRKIHAIFPTITIFALWRIVFEYRKAIGYVPDENPIILDLLAVLTTVFTFLACYAGSRLIRKSPPRYWLAKYLTTLGISISPIVLFFLFELKGSYVVAGQLFFRILFLVAVTESIAGFLISNIEIRSQKLESHQESLLVAEEQFRASVSHYLHDNLQTRLVAAGIALNQIRHAVDDENSRKIYSVVADIENIRSLGVRDFSKSITPNIEQEGLEVCVERLLSDYENVVSCRLHNFAAFDLDIETRRSFELGVYRIIEQALLNSLAHGRASEFEVYASRSEKNMKLEIVNNGILYDSHQANQGHGFAVIDAWVNKFGGTWNISNADSKVVIAITW